VPFEPKAATRAEIAERIKSILETRGLTLYQVCRKAETIYGHASPYHLPHNLYYRLKLGAFSPTLYQLFALSRITNYRLTDWLHVFGLDLTELPRMQTLLPVNRTILLDSSLVNPIALVPWFHDKSPNITIPAVAPLSQLLAPRPTVRQGSLLKISNQRFLYAKIGLQDALAFPDLLPGSIVRVDPRLKGGLPKAMRIPSDRPFLVEDARGFCCCRLAAVGGNRILTISTQLPYAQVELELHAEVRVLGTVDLEIRPLTRIGQPNVPKEFANRWKPTRLPRRSTSLSQLLGAARLKAGLSLREASGFSRRIATMLDDPHYFMSPSSLSDYEARDTPPRDIQKIITLCAIYAVPFQTFLNTLDLSSEKAGQEPIPAHFVSKMPSESLGESPDPQEREDGRFLRELLRRGEDVPVFLRNAIANISGLSSPSLHNLFWIGGIENPLHRYLANGLLASVDLHKQKAIDSRSRPPWQQSLYVVIKRDGTYLCGPCAVENGTLVMHPDMEHLNLREQFRNRRDAEVAGQITAIARRLV
jgi:transcriptional regulator with XRE-family HTH domain